MNELSGMILSLAQAVGVSGREDQAAQVAREYLEPLGSCETTPLGSLICRMKPAQEGQPHLLLTAHLDEIGMIVSSIDAKGFLRVSNCGGVDRSTLPAAHVVVHTESGSIDGVVCAAPPHLSPDDETIPKIEAFSIDVGLSAEQAKKRVALGDRVTLAFEPVELLNGRICCKALDDRAGCAAVILAAQKLAAQDLTCGLSVLLATMEEAGGFGSKTGAAILQPTHAFAVDVSFAHTPDAPREKCGEIGKGPMIGVSPILDNTLFRRFTALAGEMKIPYQLEVMGGNTGTDVDQVAVTGAGVKCALLSIPQRYMHTSVEVISPADVQATADLMAACAVQLFGGDRHAV